MPAEQTTALRGKNVAVLMTDGVEQVEYTDPRNFLESHGARVTLVAPKPKGSDITGFHHFAPADHFKVEMDVRDASPGEFDALVLPGGVANPDQLRLSKEAIAFIRGFASEDKPIAAICHGPWTLIDAEVVRGKHVTSWPSLKEDLRNAGAVWTDEPVVVDGKLVTSRKPDDLPAFDQALLQELTQVSDATLDIMMEGLGHDQHDEQDLGPLSDDNVSESLHNVQDEPGSQLTG